ncbi:FecR family protein [Marinigracilibium pacificum]|uniref:FecR family protein n=1 Tax=Marinigracilibium pacificum TaxID=2729599 RepID=A0A848J509_9BACT|nr:FecR family protein [Marinigracilibium pacificum]NMM49600.1 FecR family protein [Marinigracilibium pacificum]
MKEGNDDTFLGRWLNGDLSDEERALFEASEEFKKYQKIIAATENIEHQDFDAESVYQNIKQKTHGQTASQSKSLPKYWFGVAAAIVLLITTFLFLYKPVSIYETEYGQISKVSLPDGSVVKLNAKSKVVFNKSNWNENRNIELSGEAFFDVEKGNQFTVNTIIGSVTVLGTEFNVTQLDNYFRVACYEGKVLVKSGDYKKELLPGMVLQINNNKVENSETTERSPAWMSNNSEFVNAPIKVVILTLENQYGVAVDYKLINEELTFTGRFPNNDLNTALQIIAESIGLSYSQEGERIIFKTN